MILPDRIRDIAKKPAGTGVKLQGWVGNIRSSGSIVFVQFRDGSGLLQAVVAKDAVSPEDFQAAKSLSLESSLEIEGTTKPEPRAPGGLEVQVTKLSLIHKAEEYPIGKKEHGPEFLFDQRHLWLRSAKQKAILRIRDEVIWAMRNFLRQEDFTLTDSPILTPNAAEGTTQLFKVDYFGENAFLAQTGQLYIEATAAALGRVYDFGPTFRAEKSKTRRHLTEFWMLDAEAAFMDQAQNMELQEAMVVYVVQSVLKNCADELAVLERDIEKLEAIQAPFPRMTYTEAIETLKKAKVKIDWGDDLGADEEEALSKLHDRPVFITEYPVELKAFYMKPNPANPKVVLCNDLLAPEGVGEIIGGSQRIDDYDLLKQRILEHKLPLKEFEWYLDLRKYGSFPHSGFGIGLERTVGWIAGLHHIREAIPFPRLLNRLTP
jgi:asparaginyl-tRNA synthetase